MCMSKQWTHRTHYDSKPHANRVHDLYHGLLIQKTGGGEGGT